MAVQGNANAGRLSIGEHDLDSAWASMAGEPARDGMPDALRPGGTSAADAGSDLPFSMFGEGQSEAEAFLYAYLDRARGGRPSGFAPYDELSARLSELTPASRRSEASFQPAKEEPGLTAESPRGSGGRQGELAWFDAKFGELRSLITVREDGRSEIVGINAKLDEIIGRVDRLSAAMPGEKTMAAVETQLGALSRSLDTARERGAADADRISQAAEEILAATDRAQEARVGFENAARHTVRQLAQTVAVTASRAAMVTAEQIASALSQNNDGGVARLEGELRALNTQSRESGERTASQLEGVHQTLREFLEQGRPTPAHTVLPFPAKRANLHIPIAADAPAYAKADSGFGSAPALKPQLDMLTLRIGPSPDCNPLTILREADARLAASKKHSSTWSGISDDVAAPPAFLNAQLFREEEKGLPVFGLGIIAVVLLLASVALLYLHTRADPVPLHLTALPQVHTSTQSPVASAPTLKEPARWSMTLDDPQAPPSREYPALFTAADQNLVRAASKPDEAAEDMQMLTGAASHGDRDAQFRIGIRFLHDMGLQNDPATAARWLARAADQGHVESHFVLASLFERGAGVPRDESQAVELYRKAASAGHIRAMHNLGVLLSMRDTPQDYREAAGWFLQAASAGLAESQYNLALLYERGLGLEEDQQKAYFWYQVAALAGDKEAMQRVERLKQQLPPSDSQTVAEHASSWRPAIEASTHSARG